MNSKMLALSSAFATLMVVAPTAQAAPPPMMGVMYLGFAEWWDNYDFRSGGESGPQFDYKHPSLYGFGKVNVPYDSDVNLQFDLFGDASMHESSNLEVGGRGNFGAGVHINARDSNEGLLGVFGATGRVWDVFALNNSPVVMAGLEGQYYCGHWTFYGQGGYMDSDANAGFMQNAGFVRGLVSYYASPRLKLTGGLGYVDGDLDGDNATAVAWQADGQYWFGRSVPVAVTLKYEGRRSDVHFGSTLGRLDSNEVSVGFSFYFGGDNLEQADRTGAGTEIPNFDWFRLPVY